MARPGAAGCSCSCPPGLFGNPALACRPECVLNSDCGRGLSCADNKCVDPCPGTCGLNTQCRVINHIPTCTCLPGHRGNAFEECVECKHVREKVSQKDFYLHKLSLPKPIQLYFTQLGVKEHIFKSFWDSF